MSIDLIFIQLSVLMKMTIYECNDKYSRDVQMCDETLFNTKYINRAFAGEISGRKYLFT